MATGQDTEAKPRANTLVSFLLARRPADSRRAEYTYLVLVFLWHVVLWLSLRIVAEGWLSFGTSGDDASTPHALDWKGVRAESLHPFFWAFMLLLVMVEGLLGWLLFRFVNRPRKLPSSLFIRTWWRTCAWGTIVVPSLFLTLSIISSSMWHGMDMENVLLGQFLLLLGPAWLVRDEVRPQRGSRWRPVCPECGYSLRGLTEPRCPECGQGFPTTNKTFRRWAVRRSAWDRAVRGSLVAAYLRSLACIVFRPGRAARGLTLPDRAQRSTRWALAHLVLTAIAATLLGNGQMYVWWIVRWVRALTVPAGTFWELWAPLDAYRLLWPAQTCLAWFLPLLLAVAIACLISVCTPGRHRAAKSGGVKWSLYLTALFPLVLTAWYGLLSVPAAYALATALTRSAFPFWQFGISLSGLIVPYGLWWGMGMAANQYNRARNWTVAVGYASVFFGAWFLATRLFFASGALGALR